MAVFDKQRSLILSHHLYDPDKLLSTLKQRLNLRNDTELSKALHISVALIVQIREGRRPVAGAILMVMHEASQLSIAELRALMGDRRRSCRMASRLAQAGDSMRSYPVPTDSSIPVPEKEFPCPPTAFFPF